MKEITCPKVNLFDLIIWMFIGLIFPLSTCSIGLAGILKIIIYLGATYFVGNFFIGKLSSFNSFFSLIKTGLCIVLGSLFCGLLYLIIAKDFIIYTFFFLLIVSLFKNNNISFKTDSFCYLLCLSPLFLMLFGAEELGFGTILGYRSGGDYFYYTAIVESLKTNHTFSNAVYHQGIGINYQALGLFPAAQLANFAEIPSQFALWGVYLKILPIISFGIVATCIIEIYNYYFKPNLDQKKKYYLLFFVVCMLMFFGPIHLLNLLNNDYANTLFLGEGYVLPVGSPGFAISMLFTSICIYFILTIFTPNLLEKVSFLLFLGIVIASKLALFFPLALLLGVYALLMAYKNNWVWIVTLIFGVPFVILIFKFTLGSYDSIIGIDISRNGYYFDYFPSLADKYHIKGSVLEKTLLMFFISVFMWLNFKLIILICSFNHFIKKNINLFFLLIATFFSFIISCLPSFFLDVYGKDTNGQFIFDARFDMPQFIRGSIFLITVIAILFLLYFIISYKNKIVNYFTLIICFFWIGIISISFIKSNLNKSSFVINQGWYNDVIIDFHLINPKLMAMIGDGTYSGQTVCGMGVHPWFSSGSRLKGGDYTMTSSAYQRSVILQGLFDSTKTIYQKKNVFKYLEKEGVDYFVATPNTMHKIKTAIQDSFLIRVKGSKWFFKLNHDNKSK